MVIAVLDDLMFTSKIRTTAAGLGVTVAFARSADAALTAIREQRPSLVLLDLNNPRTDPLRLASTLAEDPTLRDVATVGFVSHVQTELIDAARAAGVRHVLARSAFTQQLADILRGH